MSQEIVLNTIFQVKRGTKARWEELNPILRQGEPGFVIDQNKLKIGDGTTSWNDLPYLEANVEINDIPAAKEDSPGLIQGNEFVTIEEGEIKAISTDILVPGENEIVFDCGGADN